MDTPTFIQRAKGSGRSLKAAALSLTSTLILCSASGVVQAAEGGDFSLDLTAAAPYTYNHAIGGGAYNERDVGKYDDIVESLEGGDFRCGDIVTYLTQIRVGDGAVGAQTIELYYEFLANSTGQPGVALSDIVDVAVNYGCVINGSVPEGSCNAAATPRPEGIDHGIHDDGESVAILTHEELTGPLFQAKSLLKGTVQVNDLEASEKVVVRTDVRLACDPGSQPTGNLQAAIVKAKAILPAPEDAISVGNQTVPFKQIGNIGFAELSVIKTVTEDNGICPGVETLEIFEGDTVKYCYEVSNVGTMPVLDLNLVDDNGTPGNTGDDFVISVSGLTDEDSDGQSDDLGAGKTVEGEALVTIDADFEGVVTNIVYANGKPVDQKTDDATVTVTLERGLRIEKKAVLASVANPDWLVDCADPIDVPAGAEVVYCYKVTNTGNVDLYNVTKILDDNAWGDSFNVAISGLDDLDEDGEFDDLGSEDVAYAFSAPVPMDTVKQAPYERTNVAQVGADSVEPVTDDATVNVLRPVGECTMNVRVSTDGICPVPPAGEEVFILSGTSVTWCVSVTNGIEADLVTVLASTTTDGINFTPLGDLGPLARDASAGAQFDQTIEDDTTLTASAVATDVYGNVYTCAEDSAHANVVHPSLNIVKTVVVASDGNCDNSSDPLAVVAGTEVSYCYAVSNEGDTDLVNVAVSDDKLGAIGTIASLPVGTSQTIQSDPVAIPVDTDNIGTAAGEDVYGYPVSDSDDALVAALFADVVVEKSGTAVVIASGDKSMSYTITVSNVGDTSAMNVVLDDPLPAGFVYGSVEPSTGCTLTASTLSCALGDMAPGDSIVLTVTGQTTLASGIMENHACATTETQETYYGNNCDDTTTRVAPGATRTIGFWGNHPAYMEQCLAASNWQVDLGFYAMDASADETLQSQMLSDSIGIIKTNIAKNTCGEHRDSVLKTQLQSGRQVLAAYCNVTLLGGGFEGFAGYSDFDTFLAQWLAAATVEPGEDESEAIHEMLTLGGIADSFNNSGDDIPLDGSPGPANPHFVWTDPTSPDTCPVPTKGKKPKGLVEGLAAAGCSIGGASAPDPLLPLLVVIAAVALWRRRVIKV